MKRSVMWVGFVAFAMACTGDAVGPTQDEAVPPPLPSFSKAIHDAWDEPFVLDGLVDWIACANDGAGEWTDWTGFIDGHYRQTITPSGNVILHWKLDYDTANPASFTGRESGDLWQLVRAEDTGGSISKPKGTQYVEHWQYNEFYKNQDGDKLHIRVKFQMLIDADGNVKLDRFDIRCN